MGLCDVAALSTQSCQPQTTCTNCFPTIVRGWVDKSNEQHYEMAETMFTLRSVKAISSMMIEVVTHFNN